MEISRICLALKAATSPTVVQLHAALFSWALARSLQGDFILNFVDSEAAPEPILDALRWLGLDWDEDVEDEDEPITHIVCADGVDSAEIQAQHLTANLVTLPQLVTSDGDPLPARGHLVRNLQQSGYLPEAVFDYLLRLGWFDADSEEILTKWPVRKQFRLEAVSAESQLFNWQALDIINQRCITKLSDEKLADLLREFLEDAYGSLPMHGTWLTQLTAATRHDLVRLEDIIEAAEWAFDPMPDFVGDSEAVLQASAAKVVLVRLSAEIMQLVLLDAPSATKILAGLEDALLDEQGYKGDQIRPIIQVALIGNTSGTSLAAIMGILGKQRCLERLAAALRVIRNP